MRSMTSRRSRTYRKVARRRRPTAGMTKSDSGTSEWHHTPFYSSHTSISWPHGKSSRARAKFAALTLAPASAPLNSDSAPPSASKRDYGHSQGDGLHLAPNRV